ncbi:MAG: beta-lactamase family protein [Myxococcales bacterium]|nr:beta-lactamase family protein [Myxococcales bacterium]
MRALAFACIAASLAGCARVAAPVPAPPAPVAGAEPPAAADPELAPQRIAFAHALPAFLDPERRARLEAAFPAIDAYLQQTVARDDLVGLAAGIVIDGELAWFRGYGHRDSERGLPVERDTVFGIGSITKTFTALAALRLRDEGRLDLDRPASTYFPALDGLVYPTADSPRLSIRHILTHTAGLPRSGDFGEDQGHPPLRAEILASLDGVVLDHPPGQRHVYSNLGFQLLGLLVGEVTGVGHRAYIRDALLAPLGMNHTLWVPEDVPGDRIARPYKRESDQWQVRPHWRFGDADASGALFSSVEDLARFAAFNLAAWPARDEPEAGPLRRATLREAHTLGSFVSFRAESVRDAPARGRHEGIGLGFVIQGNCRHDHIVMHSGKTPTYRASLHMLPNHGVAVILLTNVGAVDGLALPGDGLAVLDLLADTGALEPRAPAPADARPGAGARARVLVRTSW